MYMLLCNVVSYAVYTFVYFNLSHLTQYMFFCKSCFPTLTNMSWVFLHALKDLYIYIIILDDSLQ